MENKKTELIALLNAISEVAERLGTSQGDKSYLEAAKVAKRIAELKKQEFTDDTVLAILHTEGYLDDEQFVSLLNM